MGVQKGLHMTHNLGIVSVGELLKANKHLNFEHATKLQDWLTKKYIGLANKSIEPSEFNNIVLDAVIADEKTYDISKGTLLKYLQTSINFEIVRLVGNTSYTPLREVIHNPEFISTEPPDLNKLSDIEVETLYMVTQGASLSDARLEILRRLKERIKSV